MLKTGPLPRTEGTGVGVNHGGITIQPYTMTPLSAAVSRKSDGVVGWGQWLQIHFTLSLTTHVCTCERLITMEMTRVVKW